MSPFIDSLKQALAQMFSVTTSMTPFSGIHPTTPAQAHEMEERHELEEYERKHRPCSSRDFIERRGYHDSFGHDDELAHGKDQKH